MAYVPGMCGVSMAPRYMWCGPNETAKPFVMVCSTRTLRRHVPGTRSDNDVVVVDDDETGWATSDILAGIHNGIIPVLVLDVVEGCGGFKTHSSKR